MPRKVRQLELLLAQQNKGAKSSQAQSGGHTSVPLEPHNTSGIQGLGQHPPWAQGAGQATHIGWGSPPAEIRKLQDRCGWFPKFMKNAVKVRWGSTVEKTLVSSPGMGGKTF